MTSMVELIESSKTKKKKGKNWKRENIVIEAKVSPNDAKMEQVQGSGEAQPNGLDDFKMLIGGQSILAVSKKKGKIEISMDMH